ncbi:hypothetical protein [Actinomarinicola tropica]|nr:hypothetical protein [Actinomarinicola tropica]
MHDHDRPAPAEAAGESEGHGHGGWAMLLCCIPMILAVVFIVIGR